MTNVFTFPRPDTVHPVPTPMSDAERDAVIRSIQKIAEHQPYPLSRLLSRMAVTVRDYPLEDVTLKDLTPKGFLISANYPNYGTHWVFRLEGHPTPRMGMPATSMDLLTPLIDGAKKMGISAHSTRFAFRYLRDLEEVVYVESIESSDEAIIVTGSVLTTIFARLEDRHYTPFSMTLTKV